MDAFHKHLPDITNIFDQGVDKFNTPEERAFIDEQFPKCSNISIDYGVMEKASNVYVMAADFGWSDLGTWGSLHEISGDKDERANAGLAGNVLFFDSSENIAAIPKNKVAVIQGLDGYIVADTDNVLLICKKEDEQRIKQFVTDVKVQYGDEFV